MQMSQQPRIYRQLQPEDRVTLASLKQQNYSVREIASVLSRSASTIAVNCAATPQLASTAAMRASKATSCAADRAADA